MTNLRTPGILLAALPRWNAGGKAVTAATALLTVALLAALAARQLERYRDDPDAKFDLPVVIEGSNLQRGVWDAMCAIPRGKTRTYGELARELGADARDIGKACGDNRLPIVIPCHRVVAADGLGGFGHSTGGYLLEVKRWLLMHEAPAFELRP